MYNFGKNMNSIGMEIVQNGRRMTVLQLLRENIWGGKSRALHRKSDREELTKIYRQLEKKEMNIEKQIHKIEYEIYKLEAKAQLNRRVCQKYKKK